MIGARDEAKGAAAVEAVKRAVPDARASLLVMDLASLASVKKAADAFKRSKRPLHVLMLNAGVMACPFAKTVDGHEMQFGTNQLREAERAGEGESGRGREGGEAA